MVKIRQVIHLIPFLVSFIVFDNVCYAMDASDVTDDSLIPLRVITDNNKHSAITGVNTGNGRGVYGEHGSGNHGYLGDRIYGVKGENKSGSLGFLGDGNKGAGGHNPNGNYGYLGTASGGVIGWGSGNNYGGWFHSDSGYGLIVEKGNVGIGTREPEETLHIQGTYQTNLKIGARASNGNAKIIFEEGNQDAMALLYDGTKNRLAIDDETTGITRLIIDRSSGNVGIGTASPDSRVSVLGDTNQDVNMDIATKETNHKATLKLCEGEGCEAGMYWEYDGTDNRMKLYGVELGTGYGPHITVNRESGKVGIGTDSPTETLTVDGKILAEEIEVVAMIPDYVFGDNYSRMSLEELEQYIQEHHYFPGIASEKEIVQGGGTISVGDSYTQLLQKVEELTLYIIEQNKKIKEMLYVINMKKAGK